MIRSAMIRRYRILLAVLVLLVCSVFALCRYNLYKVYVSNQISYIYSRTSHKVILMWTPFFGKPFDLHYLDSCPEYKNICNLTNDRRDLISAAALIFHPPDMNLSDLPEWRESKQIYTFLSQEAPPNCCLNFDSVPNFFNWTFTYRMDSDVPYPYDYMAEDRDAAIPIDRGAILSPQKFKDRIVWLASNCRTHSKREAYVDGLRKYVTVDIIGKCGNLTCRRPNRTSYNNRCEALIGDRYKFYIAFENSICTDYITEKVYSRLELNSVPLVLNRQIAKRLLPPGSYIAVDDFRDGPQQLAEYLRYLFSNDTAYLEYFKYRTIGYRKQTRDPRTGFSFGFCGLCEKLWRLRTHLYIKSHTTIGDWWGTNASCSSGLVYKLMRKEFAKHADLAAKYLPWKSDGFC